MTFLPVSTLADLETLDEDQIVDGYRSTHRGDPEPGENRGRAFWHGWRNKMIDLGEIPHDEASRLLVRECFPRGRRMTPFSPISRPLTRGRFVATARPE